MTVRILAGAVLALLVSAGAAQAHPRFVSATPARSETVSASPSEVRVTFSEAVDAAKSTLTVVDAEYKPVAVGALKADAKDKKTLVLPITKRLAPGFYRVEWRVVTPDHGAVPGRYRFEVKP
jgi:copper resistance protein C